MRTMRSSSVCPRTRARSPSAQHLFEHHDFADSFKAHDAHHVERFVEHDFATALQFFDVRFLG